MHNFLSTEFNGIHKSLLCDDNFGSHSSFGVYIGTFSGKQVGPSCLTFVFLGFLFLNNDWSSHFSTYEMGMDFTFIPHSVYFFFYDGT